MTDYNLVKLIIHPKWAQAWQNIPSEQGPDPKSSVQHLPRELKQGSNPKSSVHRLPRGLIPSSLIVRDKDRTQIRFALTPEKDVNHLTEEMVVILTDQDNTQIEGKVLSIKDDQVTLNSGRKYIKVFKPKSMISVKDIELNPLVSLLGIQSTSPDIYMQYILNSLSWKINYSVTLIGKKEIKISIRAGIVNNSHSSFSSRNIVLMAGKVSHPPEDSYQLETSRPVALMAKSSGDQKKQSYSEDLIKIVEFSGVLKPGEMYINTDKIYKTGYLKLYRHYFDRERTDVIYRFDSPDQIPPGEVLVYEGNEEDFIGSSFIPESNRGQLVNLLMGESSLEIISTIELKRTIMINLSGDKLKAEEITLTAKFTNPRQESVPVLLIYDAPRRILKSNYKYNRRSGYTYEWLVNFQSSSDKQIITINIIQMADQSKKEEEIQKVGSSISEKSAVFDTQNNRPLSMLSIPEPTLVRTFIPLGTPTNQQIQHDSLGSSSEQETYTTVDRQNPVAINFSSQTQSNQFPLQAITIPAGQPEQF